MSKYEVSANGIPFGVYEAETEQQARDLCAQDAGYDSESNMVARLECASELEAVHVAQQTSAYEIQQQTGYQWEPIAEGTFETEAAAIAGMENLETDLGWKELRVVRQLLSEDGTVILDREVIVVGAPRDEEA